MQIFVPYQEPIKCAEALWADQKRYNKQIVECGQILKAIDGETKAWANHPCTKMYKEYWTWLEYYMLCFMYYRDYKKGFNEGLDISLKHSAYANTIRPPFLTDEFCDQHKRRLYTKAPALYPQFEKFGTSEENWYFVDGELLKYVNGKRVK